MRIVPRGTRSSEFRAPLFVSWQDKFFSSLSDGQKGRVADLMRLETFDPEEVLINVGTVSQKFFVLTQGRVSVQVSESIEKAKWQRFYFNRDWLGLADQVWS